jgi:hypothetical protein
MDPAAGLVKLDRGPRSAVAPFLISSTVWRTRTEFRRNDARFPQGGPLSMGQAALSAIRVGQSGRAVIRGWASAHHSDAL